jgi:hypothetical protein
MFVGQRQGRINAVFDGTHVDGVLTDVVRRHQR